MLIELDKYESGDELQETLKVLEKHNFEYEVHRITQEFDSSFSGKSSLELFSLKVMRDQLDNINDVLTYAHDLNYSDIPSDYYLLEFTDEELLEVLVKPDEWSKEDYRLSKIILEERGKTITQGMLDSMKKSGFLT